MRTPLDTRTAADGETARLGGDACEAALPRRSITPLQWSCLHDAAAGHTLAPTRRRQDLWGAAEDGAIFHSAHVLAALHRDGLLERLGRNRYVGCAMTPRALELPVRPR